MNDKIVFFKEAEYLSTTFDTNKFKDPITLQIIDFENSNVCYETRINCVFEPEWSKDIDFLKDGRRYLIVIYSQSKKYLGLFDK